MGFLNSLISKITGSSQSSSEPATPSHSPGPTVVHNNPLYEPDEHEFVNPLYNPASAAVPDRETPLGTLQKSLEHSQKGGLRSIFSMSGGENSEGFQSLLGTLSRVNEQSKRKLSGDVGADAAKLQEFLGLYDTLIADCEQYMNRRVVLTSAGRERQRIVGEVYDFAVKDREAIDRAVSDVFNIPADQRSGISFSDLIAEGRMLKFTVNNINSDVGGANASVVYKLKNKGKDYFFKSEENVMGFQGRTSFDFFEDAKSKMSLPDGPEHATLRTNLEQIIGRFDDYFDTNPDTNPATANDPEAWKQFVKKVYRKGEQVPPDDQIEEMLPYIKRLCKTAAGHFTTSGILDDLGLHAEAGAANEFNVSKRNVATSRMAELLGVGDLIAHSETAEVTDQKTGRKVLGNLMAKAEGVEEEDALRNIQGHTSAEVTSGGFQRATICLQLLDNICGQVDRHLKNMMYQLNGGTMSGVQGIDNDLAFGEKDAIHDNFKSRNARPAFSENGGNNTMTIPYMDKTMAQNVIELAGKPETVRFAMSDVLRPVEIDALCSRLRKAADALQAAMQEDSTKDFAQGNRFLEAGDWNAHKDQIHANLMAKEANRFGFEGKTYYSNIMSEIDERHARAQH